MSTHVPRIVVLGAGFGGLTFCQTFRHPTATVTIIDRQNHHLFQPLLYQVATAGLSAPEIAQPIRSILRDHPNVAVHLAAVTDIRVAEKEVVTDTGIFPYDYLVVALGGRTSYFGHPEWEKFAPGLKSLDDAQRIRRQLLIAFEKAETATDPEVRRRLMTVVVVGGGPTGVELAGAVAELSRYVLRSDFKRIDSAQTRVLLVEGSPRLLGQFAPELSAEAKDRLEKMGVEVRLDTKVLDIREGEVDVTGETLHASSIIWAAGVAASPLTAKLDAKLDRGGRVFVAPDLSLPNHPEIFAVGDLVNLVDANGVVVPGVSPAAMQEAKHVARQIADELDGLPEPRTPFRYWDKGSMATIGRSAAVAQIGHFQLTGYPAWLAWLFVHLAFLIGLRNKVAVMLQWVYSYFTYRRGARIITGMPRKD
ncbi:MAG TPA: NAD(P)/FAD-dependent oxidoreductase [Candidatus Limnocylindria bacterium]|jgi:NADH dehydrogenase|nr:NAD(P)/FAD-dependent oxidoreductase [Candidatus Limnocylindria bacterium]